MKTIKTNTLQAILLMVGILLTASCNNDNKNSQNNKTTPAIENTDIEKDLIVGSWEDTSPAALHFTLLKDGTAHSDNMKTLLYKKWSVKGNQITFTIESIGNQTSFIDEDTYTIEKITKDELILKKGDYLSKYIRKTDSAL